MDYSALSDFEINSAVHNALMKEPYKMEFLGGDRIRWISKTSDVVTNKTEYSKNTLSDYCNNPADAWPIIFSSRIGIAPGTATDKWAAHHGDWDICMADENPLRAAMVVFLMMQEKNSNGV